MARMALLALVAVFVPGCVQEGEPLGSDEGTWNPVSGGSSPTFGCPLAAEFLALKVTL